MKSAFAQTKNWIESFSEKPYSAAALFALAVLESSFLPVPLDALFLPLSLAQPRRAILNASICVVGSTIGALAGYYIGYLFFDVVGSRIVDYFGWHQMFEQILLQYKEHAWYAIVFAGFTPIPFEVFTYSAGFNHAVEMSTFLPAVFVGRTIRFLPVGILLFVFGPKVKDLLRKYFFQTVVLAGLLFLLWFFVIQKLN